MYNFRGSAIAKIVGANAAKLNNFEDRVTMYVYEETINGKKLTEIINETHENVKYLPGHKLPPNVVSKFLCTCLSILFLIIKTIVFHAKKLIKNIICILKLFYIPLFLPLSIMYITLIS